MYTGDSTGGTTGGSTGDDELGSTTGDASETGEGSDESSGSTSVAQGYCGDGIIGGEEACDDANQDLLDGCLDDCRHGPLGITIDDTMPTPLPQNGSVGGGTATDDACPPGEVVIGLRGAAGGWITQLGVVCGAVALVDGQIIGVSVRESTELPIRGLLSGSMFDSICPAGEVVVGVRGRSGALIDQLVLSCAPLSVVDDGVSLSLELGASSEQPPVGGSGGTAFDATECPPGAVATIGRIRAGDSIDAFGLTCMPIGLAF